MSIFKSKPLNLEHPKLTFKRLITFLVGITLYAVAFNIFFLPFKIVIGGISGISIIFNYFLGIEPYLFILIGSLILIMISFILLTKKQTMTYIFGSLMLPLFIYFTSPLTSMNLLEGADILIVIIFGAMMMGAGTGLIFKTGFLTGESDIMCQIVAKYLHTTPTKALLTISGIIIVFGGLLTTTETYDFLKVIYAIVALYISSTVSEKVIIGISSNKTFYIFTDKVEEVKQYIKNEFNISYTILKATGGYSNHREHVIMCVIPTRDYFKIREGLIIIDPNAFFVATDAYETTQKDLFEEGSE